MVLRATSLCHCRISNNIISQSGYNYLPKKHNSFFIIIKCFYVFDPLLVIPWPIIEAIGAVIMITGII